MNINNNINNIRQNLPPGCRLVAVSKTQPMENIMEAYKGGQRLFGENKVQELVPKYAALPKDIEWHMIGHLQTNKVRYIAPFVHCIQSVDSLRLLKEINKQAQKANRTISCLLQVFIAAEETKFGFSEEEISDLLHSGVVADLNNISITGLMGMATFTEDTDQVRSEFRKLKRFFDKLAGMTLPGNMSMNELSIGMSGDYQIAAEEGSTLVRVGTAIFGSRTTQK
ncbi:MAG TPA: YggS family pyridoxal phosphate-dependent enzyme [Ohtaekwangia sp.]|nr:YggS family pyridoxal phosphate-dependent enzyme [Ohtaekwangia sp.]